MSLFSSFRFVNGGGVAGLRTLVQRETSFPKRTDNDNYKTLPLELKSFEGLRVTLTQGLAERGWTGVLTGYGATTAAGTLVASRQYNEFEETFTDTNGTGITAHTGDAPWYYGWAAYNYTTEPTIETNRLRGPGATDTAQIWCIPYWTPTVVAENDFWIEAEFYRRTSTAGATTEIINTGVVIRGSGANRDGYGIGWNELDDLWYILKYTAGVPSLLYGFVISNDFSGTSQARRLLVNVKTISGTYDVQIDVYGGTTTSGYPSTPDASTVDYGSSYGGLGYYEVGVVFEETNGVDVEGLRLYNDLVKLDGAQLTTTPGEVVDHSRRLTSLVATTAQGTVSIGGGADVEQALTGEDATTAYGTITPEVGGASVELTGEDATTAQGALAPTHVIVADQAIGALAPRVAWTYRNNTSDQNPGNIGTQFLPWAGILYGAGNDGNESVLKRFPRSGLKQVSQITEETYPWTANPTWTLSDNASIAIEDPTAPVNNALSYGKLFPRGAFGDTGTGYRYTTAYSKGGWLTITTGGHLWSAVERVHARNNGISVYLAPHPGEIKSGTSYYYNGPELFTGRAPPLGQTNDPLRQQYFDTAPMGLYPLSENELLAFYPQIIDGQISGKFADLVGIRLITQFDPPTASYTGSDGATLVGYAATTAQGTITNDGPNKYVELGGFDATTAQGYLYARDANVVPAFRRLKDGAWQDTPVLASSFTGAARVWARSHYMTVIPSGYGDLIYVAYYSQGWANVDPKIGLIVMDAASGAVTSNTLYSVAGTPFTRFAEGDTVFGEAVDELTRPWGPHRTVALTHKLGNGTHVTQFLLCGQVVHVSWTSGARTTPTVTVKDGVALSALNAAYPAWESLEVRGDNVYHVVPTGTYTNYSYNGGVGTLYVNDATGTSSTWTTPTLSTTTSGTQDSIREVMVWYGGYGGGRKSWWYLHWWDGSSGTERGNDTGWFDHWYSQPKLISVEARALLGRVTLTIEEADKTVALTGLAATTAHGTIYADITYQRQLTGQLATTAQGLIVPEGGDVIAALSGQAATTAYGTLTPTLGGADVTIGLIHGHIDTYIGVITIPIVEVPGLSAVTAQGTMGLAIDQAPEQTGLVATAVQGTIVPEVAPSLIGEEATGDVEPPIPGIAAPWWSWGLFSQARGGTLSRFAEDVVALTGNAASTQQGTLVPVVAEDSSISGQSATSSAGLLTPVILVTMTGQQTVSEHGAVTANLVYQLTGLVTTAQEGSCSISLEIFLTGRSAATSQGVLGYQYGGSVAASGFQMQLLLGSVSDTFKKPSSDLLLWALHRTEELFAQESPDEENPVVAPNE